MVHALRESWRVLISEGALIDLRPRSAQYAIEMLTPTQAISVGDIEAYGVQGDDDAADSAARQLVEVGAFALRREIFFHNEFRFGTIAEMASCLAESRRVQHVHPSYEELEAAHRDLSATLPDVRLRYQRPMMLAVYSKLNHTTVRL